MGVLIGGGLKRVLPRYAQKRGKPCTDASNRFWTTPGGRPYLGPEPARSRVAIPPIPPSSRVSEILRGPDLSDPARADELLALVYGELRALAARQLRRERDALTLQPTALVHEAYLRLVQGPSIAWEGRAHFYRVAARAMRQVLVDAARRRGAERRGGDVQRVTLDPDMVADDGTDHAIVDLHEALERLGQVDATLERLTELRFFTGLTLEETADALGVSRRKAAKDWAAARLWLRRELQS